MASVHSATDIETGMTTLAHEPGGGLIVPLDGFLAEHDKLIIELPERLFAAMKRSAILIARRSVAVSTIALRNSHQRFDDESARCSVFEA